MKVQRAESDVIDAAHRLRILGVSEDIRALLDHAAKANEVSVDENVTLYQINSPFDGTVTTKDVVVSQRAEPNDVLFTVADLNTVWVTANIPESDVAKVPMIQGGAIRLTSAAYGSRSLSRQAALGGRDGRPADPDRSAPGPIRQPRGSAQARACSCESSWTARRPSGP